MGTMTTINEITPTSIPADERGIEHGWIMVGKRKGRYWRGRYMRHSSGGAAHVQVHGSWTMRREEEKGDVIGFYHTHPTFPADPSDRDIRTMQAFVSCFGKPLLCVIKGTDGVRAFIFDSDESEGREVRVCKRFCWWWRCDLVVKD